MRFFDLHCDTITQCYKKGQNLEKNDLHISLIKGIPSFEAWVQVFAIWVEDYMRGQAAWDYFEQNYALYRKQDVCFCTSQEDLEQAFRQGKCASVLAVEGGAVLMGEPDKLQAVYDRGVRLITLTWNGENEIGYGCQAGDGHLKPFGREVVREMETLRMGVDVSHLNETGFYDVLEMTNGPVLATHSTSAQMLMKTREPSEDRDFVIRRALTDDQIRALAQHGGIVGLNLYNRFLGDPGRDGMDAALRHAYHFLELGGENFLAMGSDFDGCRIVPEMAGIEKMPDLYEYFVKNGLGKPLCDKIFFNNALQFMKNVL